MNPRDRKPDQVLTRSAIHLLHRAGQCAGEIFADEVASDGPTPRQYAVLVAVAGNSGMSQTGLVRQTGIDRSTLADIISRMLKKGLVSRRRSKADARVYAVQLTAKGRKALSAADPAVSNADKRLLAGLPPARRREFLESLSEIVENIGSADGKATR